MAPTEKTVSILSISGRQIHLVSCGGCSSDTIHNKKVGGVV